MALTTIEANGVEAASAVHCKRFSPISGLTGAHSPAFRPSGRCRISSRSRSNRSNGSSVRACASSWRRSRRSRSSQENGADLRRIPVRRALEAIAGTPPAAGEGRPRIVEQFCRERDITYASPLRIKAKLRVVNPETGEIREIGAGEDEDSKIFRRLPDDDDRRHVHHQRRRARRRLAAGSLAGRLFRALRSDRRASSFSTAKLIPNRGPGSSSRPRIVTSCRSRSTASARCR